MRRQLPFACSCCFLGFLPILRSTPPSRCDLPDAERLGAALGAAVVGAVGVAGVRLVAHLLMDAPRTLMGADDVGRGRRRVDRRRTAGARGARVAAVRRVGRRIDGGRSVVSIRPRKATGPHLGAGGGAGLVGVELAVGRAPDHRARARAQQGGTERGCHCLSHVHSVSVPFLLGLALDWRRKDPPWRGRRGALSRATGRSGCFEGGTEGISSLGGPETADSQTLVSARGPFRAPSFTEGAAPLRTP